MGQGQRQGAGVAERAVLRRAVEAVVWGMPAVNYRMMYEAAVRLGGPQDNKIVFWPGLFDWRNQTLTPNPDVIYVMPFLTTKDGPVVLEVPPAGEDGALNGSIMNYWQTAIEDIGPAGIDQGNGGRCLVLPPGFTGDVPDGYIPLRSDTFQVYGLIRSVLTGGSDRQIEQAIDYAKRIKVYPLAEADQPPETAWVAAGEDVQRRRASAHRSRRNSVDGPLDLWGIEPGGHRQGDRSPESGPYSLPHTLPILGYLRVLDACDLDCMRRRHDAGGCICFADG